MPELFDVRLITMVTPSLRGRIEEHRWSSRLPSMADAVRDLIERGLGAPDAQPTPILVGEGVIGADGTATVALSPSRASPGPLPTVTVPDSDMVGSTPMVVQWLNRAIQQQQRVTFAEDDLFRGAWSKPESYGLTPGDRKAVQLAMKPTGWKRDTVRAGRAPGDPLHTWSAVAAS